MPPKKREQPPIEAPKPPRAEPLRTDHELFLQAFEKPTQIYRYLRTRQLASPIFLHRTLTYMNHRMSRTHKNRKNFKVDSLLQRVQAQHDSSSCRNLQFCSLKMGLDANARFDRFKTSPTQMTLTFTGFYDCSSRRGAVTAEAVVLKICNKKKREVDSSSMQLSVGCCEVPHNPEAVYRGSCHGKRQTVITVPSNSFCPNGTGMVRSYVLLLRITEGTQVNDSDSGEPLAKKQRRNGCTRPAASEESRHYVGELVVYEQQRCLLTEGEYQVALRPWGPKAAPLARTTSWETLAYPQGGVPLESFEKSPRVVFRLTWGGTEDPSEDGGARLPRPVLSPVEMNVAEQGLKHVRSRRNGELKASESHGASSGAAASGAAAPAVQQQTKGRTRVVYQFVYNQQTRQQTEARGDLRCPWCLLQCRLLAALLKHLKLCHGRFSFAYGPHPKGARIDVSINECYDGSYAGNPQQLHTQTGYAFGRTGPARRTPVTYVMACRPKRAPLSLSEFMEQDEVDIDLPRPYISGHNRLYYHTETCLPIRPQEIDRDSESEDDPDWLRIKTQLMIDEFTDVNEGEKELMKMWNLHIMKHGFVGDCQIALACNLFVEQQGEVLMQRNLYRNFVLHMCNLLDFGLVSTSVVYTTVRRLQMFCDVKDRKLHIPRRSLLST